MGTSKGYISPTTPHWSQAKRAVTSFGNNRDYSSKAKAASKCASAMMADMSSGGSFQSAAAGGLGFAQKVATNGLNEALKEYNREDLIGKPSDVAWLELLHDFTNAGATTEDNLVADALSQALENLNIEDISQIGSISTDILLKEMLKEYIKAHLEIKTGRKIYETDGEYYICPITEQDRIDYVELHRQINGEGTLFLNPVCKDMMWENVLQGKDRVFSIFDKNAQYCGSIELQNPLSETPEIGIDLLENMRNKGIAPRVIRMFAKKTYEMQSVEYFIIRISSRNLHSKHVFEKMGVILICEEESLFTAFMKNFKEVVEEQDMSSIHDRLKECSGEIENTEEEVVYRYKFTLDMF